MGFSPFLPPGEGTCVHTLASQGSERLHTGITRSAEPEPRPKYGSHIR